LPVAWLGPGAGGVVSRPRLFERLAAPARVTVVSAPAGSGKTVLLRSWIAQAGLTGCAAWVPVGRGGGDPQLFWLSVLAGATEQLVQYHRAGILVTTHPIHDRGKRTGWADLPEVKVRFFMPNPAMVPERGGDGGGGLRNAGLRTAVGKALFRLRQSEGILRFGQRYGADRLETAYQRAVDAGDPS
jgi:hypothetical protein